MPNPTPRVRPPSKIGRFAPILAALFTTGCLPNLPFHLAETAEVLQAKQVRVTPAIGYVGPIGSQPTASAGAGLRLRVGVGHDQEVGVEGAIMVDATGVSNATGKLSWKLGLEPWLAFIAGAGVGWSAAATEPNLGVDLALVASRRIAPDSEFYAGLRLNGAFALHEDARQDPGSGLSVIAPAGFAVHITLHTTLYFEVGVGDTTQFLHHNDDQSMASSENYNVLFAYGMIGGSYTFGDGPQPWWKSY